MAIGLEIEEIRKKMSIPEFVICNIMCVSESEYTAIKTDRVVPTTFSMIMFVATTEKLPPSLEKYYPVK